MRLALAVDDYLIENCESGFITTVEHLADYCHLALLTPDFQTSWSDVSFIVIEDDFGVDEITQSHILGYDFVSCDRNLSSYRDRDSLYDIWKKRLVGDE